MSNLKVGDAVAHGGKAWRIIDTVEAVGGAETAMLECLDVPHAASVAVTNLEPLSLSESEIADRILDRERRQAPIRHAQMVGMMRKQIAKCYDGEECINPERAERIRGDLARLEGGAL